MTRLDLRPLVPCAPCSRVGFVWRWGRLEPCDRCGGVGCFVAGVSERITELSPRHWYWLGVAMEAGNG